MGDPLKTHSFPCWLQNCHQLNCSLTVSQLVYKLILHGWLTGDSLISLLKLYLLHVFNRLTTQCLHEWPIGDPLNSTLKFIFSHVFYRLTTQCLHGWHTCDPLISLVITKLSQFHYSYFLYFAWWHIGDPFISLLITNLQQFHYLHVFNELTTYFCMGDSLVTHSIPFFKFNFSHGCRWETTVVCMGDPLVTHSLPCWLQNCHQLNCLQVHNWVTS